jgi:hypothetical protein
MAEQIESRSADRYNEEFDPNNIPMYFDPGYMNGLMEAYGFGEATGTKLTREWSSGVDVNDYLKKKFGIGSDAKAEAITKLLEEKGIDLNQRYGATDDQRELIENRINYLWKYWEDTDSDKRSRSIDNLVRDFEEVDIGAYEEKWVKMDGLAGLTTSEKINAMRTWSNNNPGAAIDWGNKDQLAKIFGVDAADVTDEDATKMSQMINSDEFKRANMQQDIINKSLEMQQQSMEYYSQKLEEMRKPGYAKEAVDAAFAPQQTQLDQYYQPQGGARISQAGSEVGEGEAGLGRTGYDRVAAELGRQKGMAYERMESQKSAARQQLQQYIDLGNPAEALRMGSAIGQQGQQYMDIGQARLTAPYQQLFGMNLQNYQAQLMPYSLALQYSQPEGGDWWSPILGAGMTVAGGVAGAMVGGPAGAVAGAGVGYQAGRSF